MNVWIWGPPMWDVLHGASFLCDAYGPSYDNLVRPLKTLLPCKYCRESFVGFYDTLGRPTKGQSALWIYRAHQMVNRKLSKQRVEAFLLAQKAGPSKLADALVAHHEQLLNEPKFDVVQKRFLVDREEPLPWRSLSTALLALSMGQTAEHVAMHDFVTALIDVVKVSSQNNVAELVKFLSIVQRALLKRETFDSIRKLIESAKYDPIITNGLTKDGRDKSALIQAGVCIHGTCV